MKSTNTSLLPANAKTAAQVCRVTSGLLEKPVISAERFGKGGNSQVYGLKCSDSGQYVAKFYFCHESDKRDRLGVEFGSLSFLWENGVRCVPRPVAVSEEEGCALYEYVEGDKILSDQVTEKDIDYAVTFLTKLSELKSRPGADRLPPASEACFSVDDAITNIEWRLKRLESPADNHNHLRSFLSDDFKPFWEVLIEWCKEKSTESAFPLDAELPYEERTLSPSDFGFHNALKTREGRIIFFDFEYFGWDDPAKMISDFLLHPAMALSTDLKRRFTSQICCSSAFSGSENLEKRLELLYPLYGLKWCLIFLNEFIPDDLERRSFAGMPLNHKKEVHQEQLLKAKNMLAFIKEVYRDFPYSKGE